MSLAALRDAIDLLTSRPILWLPGAACGLLCAILWIILSLSGTFYAGRFLVLVLLAAVFFIAGTYMAIRHEKPALSDMVKGGSAYYFRILTPTLIIVFGIALVFIVVILTLALFGMQPDPGLLTFLTFGVVLPTVMLTYFYDCAAVFEEKKVFESLQRSIEVVTAHLFEVMLFYFSCLFIFCIISFMIFVAWTAALADRLEPITHYNETQLAAFSPDTLTALIGQDGIYVTAVCIFAAITILFPLITAYKACFFNLISRTTINPIRQVAGEFDSKGRWYKY
jgi:MFS family permease